MLATAIFFAVLSWTAVALRVYVRCFMRKIFGVDDWLMVVTQVRIRTQSAAPRGKS